MKKATIAALILLLAVAGCAVTERDPSGISIRHAAENDLGIQEKASRYCRETGLEAVLVQRTPADHGYLVGTVVSTYRCVPNT